MDHFDPTQAAIWFVVFLFSTTCHEAAHAAVAKWGGDLTAYYGGQVTLNPLPHIQREPIGMIVVPLLSAYVSGWPIGWASAPYDPYWADRHPRRAGLMSLAGPAANLALCLLSVALLRVGLSSGFLADSGAVVGSSPAVRILSSMALLNMLLCGFNLLPIPPLDGAGIVEGFGGKGVRNFMQNVRRAPMVGLLGLFMAWQIFPRIARPLLSLLSWLLYG